MGAAGIRHSAQGRTGLGRSLARLARHWLPPPPTRPVLALALGIALAGAAATMLRAQQVASLMADSVLIDRAGRLVASGAVEVWHGSVQLRADRISFDRRSGQLTIAGPIVLSDGPDRIIVADQADLSRDLREGIIRGARLVLDQQLQVAAARIERQDGRDDQMTAVIASSCRVCAENPTPLWEIRADRVRHDQQARQLHFERAQFRLGGVPVAYVPRLRLPEPGLDRSPGILSPRFRVTSDFGFSLGLPYFIPIGSNRDLTITPFAGGRGMMALAFRYRHAFRDGGIEFAGQLSRDQLDAGRVRGYAHLRGLFRLRNDFRLSFDLLAPTDRTYLETYGITDQARLSSDVTLERIRRDQAIRARVLGFRSLRADDDNSQVPSLALQADWEERIGLHGIGPGGALRLRFGALAYQRPALPGGGVGRDLARFNVHAHWQRHQILAGGVLFTGAVQGRIDHLRLRGAPGAFPDPVTRAALEGMAELRLPLARVDAAGGRHLLEPVAQVVLSRRNAERLSPQARLRNDDHRMPSLDGGNLFALIRYSGHDAPDDGSRVNLGLRWVRHAPTGWSVETLVGRIWRRGTLDGFDTAHVQPLGGTRSDWLLAGRLSLADGVALDTRLLLGDNRRLTRGEASLHWHNARTSVSTSYVYMPATAAEARAETLSEWSLDVGQTLRNGWIGQVGWEYDVGRQRFSTARTGLTFQNECLSVDVSLSRRFATSTNVSASTRFDLRVELLGIGGRAPANVRSRGCPA
ncbi:MAG: LPS-assembly protein LptD [Pararhodobacter sp.]